MLFRSYRVGSYNLDGTRALDENLMRNVSTKVSWQVRRANQFHVLYNFNNKGQFNRTENTGPITDFIDNAATSHQVINSSIVQAKWTSILPRKMLLDVSGSMANKIATACEAVARWLTELRPQDRFRVIVFSDRAREITDGWTAAEIGRAHV